MILGLQMEKMRRKWRTQTRMTGGAGAVMGVAAWGLVLVRAMLVGMMMRIMRMATERGEKFESAARQRWREAVATPGPFLESIEFTQSSFGTHVFALSWCKYGYLNVP